MIASCSAWMVATISDIRPVRLADSEANSAASPIKPSSIMVVQRGQIEDVVVDGDDGPPGEPDVTSPEHPDRVRRRRPVEGLRHRRAPIDEQRIVVVVEEPDPADIERRPVDRCRSGRNTIRARRSSIDPNDPRRSGRMNRVRSPPGRCRSSDRRGPVGARRSRGRGRGPTPRTAWSHSLVLGRSRASARFRSCALLGPVIVVLDEHRSLGYFGNEHRDIGALCCVQTNTTGYQFAWDLSNAENDRQARIREFSRHAARLIRIMQEPS